MDCNYRRIPNVCIVAGCIMGVLMQGILYGISGICCWLSVCLGVFLLGLPLYLLHQLGAGDCKLYMITVALLGVKKGIICLCLSFVLAGIWAVIVILALVIKRLRETGLVLGIHNLYYQKRLFSGNSWRKRTLPMAVPIFLSYLVCICM